MSNATYEDKMPIIDDFCDPEPQKEMFPGFPDFLFTPQEFANAKSNSLLTCRCSYCHSIFTRSKGDLAKKIKANKARIYCSLSCNGKVSASQNFKKDRTKHVKTEYTCIMCGKLIVPSEYYGSGKYCSMYCAHRAIAQKTHNSNFSEKVSNSLLIYNNLHPKQEPISYEAFAKLVENHNFYDIALLTSFSRQKIAQIAKKYNLSESKNFLDPHRVSVIKACRYALNKPLEAGSITYEDLEAVKCKCHHLIFEDEIPSSTVCTDFLGRKSPNVSFLRDCMQIHLPSLKEIGNRLHIKSLVDKTDKEKYYDECKFRFPDELLPYTKNSELIQKYNWYNPYFPKENGLTKDHMISKRYGYLHNIDTYLISHPANCEIMLRDDNSSKQERCSITVQQLIEKVEWWNEHIIHKIFNDFK